MQMESLYTFLCRPRVTFSGHSQGREQTIDRQLVN